MKIIVAGSRKVRNAMLLKRRLDALTAKLKAPTVATLAWEPLVCSWTFERRFSYEVWHGGEPLADMVKRADAMIAVMAGPDDVRDELVRLARKRGVKVKEVKL